MARKRVKDGRGSNKGKSGKGKSKSSGKRQYASDSFARSLAEQGLWMKDVKADGNCFFSSVSDQVYGTVHKHDQVRQEIVDYIEAHRDHYEIFFDDEIYKTFDEYLLRMRRRGEWAGNIECQAASQLYKATILVHQADAPRFQFDNQETDKIIHLAYDCDHYQSVRDLKDGGHGCPMHVEVGVAKIKPSDLSLIMQATECKNEKYIELLMKDMDQKVDQVIETMIAEKGSFADVESWHEYIETTLPSSVNNQEISDESSSTEVLSKLTTESSSTSTSSISTSHSTPKVKSNNNNGSSYHNTISSSAITTKTTKRRQPKKIKRNQICPCGSKKRYRNCCLARTQDAKNKMIEKTSSRTDVESVVNGVVTLCI
eukprot:TRINITY_DN5429_c0_g1_i1.p1 TRINITY_DN5429_c0_g1~~TRINITY_DN5429_c0_g1_i1.p1  ORF type:complete len:371 (+),score=79.97 TRINITY_DN5429_c0_g1_i1:130-1242(+)